jgi:serine/threonine-protein kinase
MTPGRVGRGATPGGDARIGAYDVLFELGHGGMGAVHLARALGAPAGVGDFERLVAIKRLHLHLTGRPDSVERFLDEAKVAARIHHANVVGIHQIGSDADGHFLVQDYVEGDNLQGLVDQATIRRQRLPPPVVLRIALDALAGLHAVHEARDAEGRPLGILHRDVATQNLLVGRDGVTRLADFGIAKHALSSVVTDGAYLQGRVLYMPPEYLERRPEIDRRFDVYGMGVTMFLALVGDVPWPGASEAQIVHLSTTVGVPKLSASGLSIAPAIEAVVARACHREVSARFASAREMLDAIEEIGRHTGWIASHGEVAALVESLAGRELAARRAAVVRARLREGVGTPEPMSTTQAIPAAPARGRVIFSFAAGGVLALAAIAFLPASRRALSSDGGSPARVSGPSDQRSAAPSSTAPAAAAPSAIAPSTAAAALPAASATAAPTASAAARSPAAPAGRPSRPLVPAPLPSPIANPAPAAPPSPPPPSAPGSISTANPYR